MPILLGTLGLLCTFINLFIGTYLLIYAQKMDIRNKGLHYIISAFSILGGIWCLFRSLQFLNHNQTEILLTLEKLNLTTALFLLSTTILLSRYLIGRKLKLFHTIILYLPAIILSIVGFSAYGIKDVISVLPLKRVTGFGYKFVSIWIFSSLIWTFYKTITGYKSSKGIQRLQLQYFIFGFHSILFIGALFGGILPLLGYEKLIPLIPYSVTLFIVSSSYITNRQPLNIEVVIYNILSSFFVPVFFISVSFVL